MRGANRRREKSAFTLIELLVVVAMIALVIGILLPMLERARMKSQRSREEQTARQTEQANAAMGVTPAEVKLPEPKIPLAVVKGFEAVIQLTPRVAVGSPERESIYDAAFSAKLGVMRGAGAGEIFSVELPLPPEIVSLSDLVVKLNGELMDGARIREGKLIWNGKLGVERALMEVTYLAVGRGMYVLQTPPGGVLETFKIDLTTAGPDVRMLDLSMQPTRVSSGVSGMQYVWDYRNVMFGRPIAVDVLGIAPIDRLGELRWLGPLSVAVFGLVVGMFGKSRAVVSFSRWTLVLIIGTFMAAYPLMYFLQEFVSMQTAMMIAAAVYPQTQGLVLTVMGIGIFVLAMILGPRVFLVQKAEREVFPVM